jgi:GYF domain 2
MTRFYLSKNGQQSGPFTAEEVQGLLQSGSIGRNDLFRSEGTETWLPLSDFGGATPSAASPPAPARGRGGPTAAGPESSKGCVKAVAVMAGLAILLIGGCVCLRVIFRSGAKHAPEQPGAAGPSPASAASTPPPIVAGPTPKPPSYEEWFISSVEHYKTRFPAAHDDAERAYARKERSREISNALPGVRTLSGWTGSLRKVETTIEGRLAIAIELPNTNILLQTWPDAAADAGAGTLIEKNSELYRRLRAMAAGSPVTFDGDFLEDKDDWVKEGSKTVLEGMVSPRFIVRFKDVKNLAK